MRRTSRWHFTSWLSSIILIKQGARLRRSSRRSRWPMMSSATRTRNRCMTAHAPTHNNPPHPLSSHISDLGQERVRVTVGINGGVRATHSVGVNSISRSTEDRATHTLVNNNNNKEGSNNRVTGKVTPTTGLLTEKSTIHTMATHGMISMRSFSGSSRRRSGGVWRRRETGDSTSSRSEARASSRTGSRTLSTGRAGGRRIRSMTRRNSRG